jgi:hypothetical protein
MSYFSLKKYNEAIKDFTQAIELVNILVNLYTGSIKIKSIFNERNILQINKRL